MNTNQLNAVRSRAHVFDVTVRRATHVFDPAGAGVGENVSGHGRREVEDVSGDAEHAAVRVRCSVARSAADRLAGHATRPRPVRSQHRRRHARAAWAAGTAVRSLGDCGQPAATHGDKVYLVSLPGRYSAWFRNLEAHPEVTVRLRGGTFDGVTREITDAEERDAGKAIYCSSVNFFDRFTYLAHRTGPPTGERIRATLERWFAVCVPLVIDLSGAPHAAAMNGVLRLVRGSAQ
ncbi:MAG: nitroreductase/quinone reductase family protein [Acidimicrobiales bacterium]